MRALYLIRHSLTEANRRRLYCGSTDLPLAAEGRAIALSRRGALPECGRYVTSGMRRADETLRLMAGRAPDEVLPDLREMDFGEFEMKAYEELQALPAFVRWAGDQTGAVGCPGGERGDQFLRRVLAAGSALLSMPADSAVVVCHGGTIVRLMETWFPDVPRHFYQWQPGPCEGYRIDVEGGRPASFREV